MLSGLIIAIAGLAMHPVPVLAADAAPDPERCGGSMLGLRPWYYDLCDKDDTSKIATPPKGEGELAKFVWKIALNILFDISLVIGYLALAMIVFGGYQYISSQGDPGKMAKGKKTLMSAVIGTTVALSASVVIHTASAVLGADLFGGKINRTDISTNVIQNILNYAYSMAGLVAVAFIIKGGVDYISSQGDPGKTAQGTRTLITAVVGLVIVILARLLTGLILSTAGGA